MARKAFSIRGSGQFRLLVILMSHGHPSESSGGAAGSPDTQPAASPELSRHVPLQCHPEDSTRLDFTLGLLEEVKVVCWPSAHL